MPLTARQRALEQAFAEIHRSRMAGLPLLHPGLRVQALDFQPLPDRPELAVGVLITPWFMNLVGLPLSDRAAAVLPPPGQPLDLDLADRRFRFFGGEEAGLGRYLAASLFSPMHSFADQAAAVATAREVLARLRVSPARRGLLFGRGRPGDRPAEALA
jgi:[NiFe] hydrogenase assembly HybE family chaperone